jgi:hypothetical protein
MFIEMLAMYNGQIGLFASQDLLLFFFMVPVSARVLQCRYLLYFLSPSNIE